jgi:hypothetical protein
MAILLLADHETSRPSDRTARALSAAAEIGGDVHVLVAGSGMDLNPTFDRYRDEDDGPRIPDHLPS